MYAAAPRARGMLPLHNKTGLPNPGTSNSDKRRISETNVSELNSVSHLDEATVRSLIRFPARPRTLLQSILTFLSVSTLSGRLVRWLPSMLKVAGSIPGLGCTDLHYARGAQGTRVGGATSQLDQPSLTPLSVASCGRLQLGVPH